MPCRGTRYCHSVLDTESRGRQEAAQFHRYMVPPLWIPAFAGITSGEPGRNENSILFVKLFVSVTIFIIKRRLVLL